jgi:hypothetical protein
MNERRISITAVNRSPSLGYQALPHSSRTLTLHHLSLPLPSNTSPTSTIASSRSALPPLIYTHPADQRVPRQLKHQLKSLSSLHSSTILPLFPHPFFKDTSTTLQSQGKSHHPCIGAYTIIHSYPECASCDNQRKSCPRFRPAWAKVP